MKRWFVLLLLCAPACNQQSEGKTIEITITAKDRKLAKLQFISFCSTCHGKYGRGDGPAAKTMIPKPRNWTDVDWQKSVTDERLYQVIRDGGAKHGLSPLMAPNPQHGENPAVLRALVELVRSYAR